MTNLSRRSLITGLIAFAATAPAIVKASSLMPVKAIDPYKEIADLILRRSYDAEQAMITHMNECIFGGKHYWITGKDQVVHYEPLPLKEIYSHIPFEFLTGVRL